ncbi:low temperature requirement protein A [Nocardiopsis gilva]
MGSVPVLRPRKKGEVPEVGAIELFFDLVYVFTVVQISHFLLGHLTLIGIAQSAVLFLAVWWGWNYTAWAMNWINPQSVAVRLLTALLMLCGLGMAIALPHAFTDEGPLFALSYVVLQLVRSSFMVWACRGSVLSRNYAHLLSWSAVASVVWVIGAFAPEEMRLPLWVLALLIDYAAPLLNFYIPGRGGTPMSTWPLHREHLAERNRLVFIIALGESILIMGFTLEEVELTAPVVMATLLGFAGLVLLWWNYFGLRIEEEVEQDPEGERQTAIARSAFAYAHAVMIAGAIVVAVSIEQVTFHPTGHTETPVAWCLVGGPILYLLGNLLYIHAIAGVVALSRIVVIAVLAALGIAAVTTHAFPPLVLAGAVTLCMLALALFGSRIGARRS